MDEKQELAIKLATEGHSILVTGQAGCGKTWILGQIVTSLRGRGKVVKVAATTGKILQLCAERMWAI